MTAIWEQFSGTYLQPGSASQSTLNSLGAVSTRMWCRRLKCHVSHGEPFGFPGNLFLTFFLTQWRAGHQPPNCPSYVRVISFWLPSSVPPIVSEPSHKPIDWTSNILPEWALPFSAFCFQHHCLVFQKSDWFPFLNLLHQNGWPVFSWKFPMCSSDQGSSLFKQEIISCSPNPISLLDRGFPITLSGVLAL